LTQQEHYGVRKPIPTDHHQGRQTVLLRVGLVSEENKEMGVELKKAYVVRGLDIGLSVQQKRHGVRIPTAAGLQQGRPTILQKRGSGQAGIDGRTHSSKAYVVRGLDIGPSVQQERRGVRIPIGNGLHQGRQTILLMGGLCVGG
jgi:hypothetical protein